MGCIFKGPERVKFFGGGKVFKVGKGVTVLEVLKFFTSQKKIVNIL